MKNGQSEGELKKDNFVHLGFCRKAHGIKGGFTFSLFNSANSTLKKGKSLTLRGLAGSSIVEEVFKLSSISFGNKVIAYLDGVVDRNTVEDMIPFDIFCLRSQLPVVSEEEFYLIDLIGLDVVDHLTKKHIGVVDAVYDNGAQDIVVVVKQSGEKLELPLIDNFFPNYDFEKGYIELIEPVLE